MKKVIICAAISGVRYTKEDNAAVPYTIDEIQREAKAAYDAGASIIHLHIRKPDGSGTLDRELYDKAVEAIYKVCPEIIILPSTGGGMGQDINDRLKIVDAQPELAMLDCDLRGNGHSIVEAEEDIRTLGNHMLYNGVKPVLECKDKGVVDNIMRIYREGWLNDPLIFNFTIGLPGGADANADNLYYLTKAIPSNSIWFASGVGENQFDIAALSVLLGGNVRVGLEDNIYLEEDILAKGNGELVKKAAGIIRALGREIATPAEARSTMELTMMYRRDYHYQIEEDRGTCAG